MLQDHQLLIIQGETGCGKSTQVPQYILEHESEKGITNSAQHHASSIRIVVTQPRRIAAATVAQRVAEERGETVGSGTVGYKIRGTTKAGPSCRILFCTTGMLLRRLASEGECNMFSSETVSYLLIDEVHERSCETDFLLTFVKRVLPKRPGLKVILMSATMDSSCFLRYFDAPGISRGPPPLLQVLDVTHGKLSRPCVIQRVGMRQISTKY